MRTQRFQSSVDQARVVAAIAAAERRTSGEIRVVISRRPVDDALAEARREFVRLGMTATAERNGVLILVAPRSQTFAVLGDDGINRTCGEGFWTGVAETMSECFRRGAFTDGLVRGIEQAGEVLARAFPRRGDDQNELPNDVIER